MAETFAVENIDYRQESLAPRSTNGRSIGSPERVLHSVTLTLSLEWVDSPFDKERTDKITEMLSRMQTMKRCCAGALDGGLNG